ncbi:hypothetical protein ELS20_00830 [Haloarcula hispanica]|uniref:Uncharacterized protein n=1 Tax=Haloarcula hispanica TaxID=51589 RepID=A0A482TS07_HALHI|nr:hypothetical protein ELS20_00830 [Haloarcula hispanica]
MGSSGQFFFVCEPVVIGVCTVVGHPVTVRVSRERVRLREPEFIAVGEVVAICVRVGRINALEP